MRFLALIAILGFMGCGEREFCYRYCKDQLGTRVEVNRGFGIGNDGKQCWCRVGVLLPSKSEVEKSK